MFNLVNKFEILVHEREQSAVDKWKKLKPTKQQISDLEAFRQVAEQHQPDSS